MKHRGSVRQLSDCPSRKVTFKTRAKAIKWIKTRHNPPHALRAYQCRMCLGWHTTSQKLKTEVQK